MSENTVMVILFVVFVVFFVVGSELWVRAGARRCREFASESFSPPALRTCVACGKPGVVNRYCVACAMEASAGDAIPYRGERPTWPDVK